MDHMRRLRLAAGFTLIELLIVISIIGLLAAVLLPNLLGISGGAKITSTKATMIQLETGCGAFSRDHGYFPPDDLKWPEEGKKANWKNDNGQNTGIESLVVFLSQGKRDGLDLGGMAEQLVNTDNDDNGADLPLLHRRERLEVADAWGTPLAYFCRAGLDRVQNVVPGPDQDAMPAKAKRRPDGVYFGVGKFQLLSAGPDKMFGTDDDIAWPEN